MIRRPVFTVLALILFVTAAVSACSKKPPLVVSQYAGSSLETLRSMTAAYEKKDLGGFLGFVAASFPGRDALSAEVAAVFRKYATIRFTIQYPKMLMMVDERGNIRLTVTWDGEWRTAGGRVVKDGGRVVFAFDPRGRHVTAIEGRNPFVPAEKQQ